jgi:hypothetical protein
MVAPNRQNGPRTTYLAHLGLTYRELEDGSLAFDFEAACGNVYKNICYALEPLSENPGLQFTGTFGMKGTIRIIEMLKDYRSKHYEA